MSSFLCFSSSLPLTRRAAHADLRGRIGHDRVGFVTRRGAGRVRLGHQRCVAASNRRTLRMDANSETSTQYTLEVSASISDFDESEWNRLARQGSACPFLEYDWLRCLEVSGSASPETGWAPRHISVRSASGALLAVAPTYIKGHSLGEFVFDNAFAEAAYSMGIDYYPKLLVGIPFTPATGRRILTVDDKNRGKLLQVTAAALLQLCRQMNLSSIHMNFCEADEADAFEEAGYMRRIGAQFHWQNSKTCEKGITGQYKDFDDFLTTLNSKRRIKLKRERAKVREAGIELRVVHGDAITPQVVESMFRVYKAGIDKHIYWGRQYLNREFFRMLGKTTSFHKHLLFVLAEDSADKSVVAGTFNVIGGPDNRAFYGRYWGSPAQVDGERNIPFLHFETCYYSAIDASIQLGLSRFEPGAGGGDSKHPRGFDAAPTYSVHWFANKQLSRAIQRYLIMETAHVQSEISEMQ